MKINWIGKLASAIAPLAVWAAVTGATWASPNWNFDCVPYAGAARAWLGDSPAATHRLVYDEVRAGLPPSARKALESGSGYRKQLARDSAAFATQLPFYANKPGYVGLIALMTRFGTSSVRAAFGVSAIAFGLLSALVLYYLWRLVSPGVALILTGCLVASPPFRETGVLATPDSLSAAALFAGVAMLFFRASGGIAASSLLVASVVVRPDSVLLVLAVFAWLGVARRQRTLAWVGVAGSTAACLLCSWLTGSYSWNALIVHTFLRRLTTDQEIRAAQVTLTEYGGILAASLRSAVMVTPSFFPIFGFLSALSIVRIRSGNSNCRDNLALQACIWVAVLAHFLAFPMLADRFFIAHYAVIAVLSVAIAAQHHASVEALRADS